MHKYDASPSISKQCLHAEPINCFQIHLKSILYIWLGLLVSIYCLHCTLAIILHACLENLLMLCKFETVFLNHMPAVWSGTFIYLCVVIKHYIHCSNKKRDLYL